MARILLTGATSGIGLAAAARLAAQGHELVVHGPESGAQAGAALARIRRAAPAGTGIGYAQADFVEPDGPRRLARQVPVTWPGLDVLVNNAAVPGPSGLRIGTAGTELAYQVNFLAGVLLTHLLLPRLAPAGRVVNVASVTHYGADLDLADLDFRRRHYLPSAAYAQSKLALVTYTNWLATQVPQTVVTVHPGVASTALLHAMFSTAGLDPRVAGAHLAHAVTAPVPTGTYLDESTPSRPSEESLDAGLQARLVTDTAARLGVPLP